MTSDALGCRVMRLERAMLVQPKQQDALVIVHAAYRDPGDLVGVYGLNDVPRLAHESAQDFINRLEKHVRAMRGRALPFVGLARYLDDND